MKYALSTLPFKYISEIEKLIKNSNAKYIEWDTNFIPLPIYQDRINFLNSPKVNFRFHMPYTSIEIAHKNNDIREYSLNLIKEYIKIISNYDCNTIILHIGCNEKFVNRDLGLLCLKNLAKFAKNKGIRICVENQYLGLSSKINFLEECINIDNIYLAFDIGHAKKMCFYQENYLEKFILLHEKIIHLHVYKEEDKYFNHIAIKNKNEINKELLSFFSHHWWTMEIDNFENQINQMKLLKKVFND